MTGLGWTLFVVGIMSDNAAMMIIGIVLVVIFDDSHKRSHRNR